MTEKPFDQQIEAAHGHLKALEQCTSESSPERQALIAEAVTGLFTTLGELRAVVEELCRQNEELAAARQAVEVERQRDQELFEFAPVSYLVTDAAGTIQKANRAAANLFLVHQDFLVGKPLALFVAEKDRQAFSTRLAGLQEGGKRRDGEWEMYLQPRGDEPFPAVLTVAATRDAGGRLVSLRWLIHGITDRKRAEEALRRHSHEMALLNRAGQALNSTLDLDQVLAVVLQEVRHLLGVVSCSVWLVAPETGELICRQSIDPQSAILHGWRLRPGEGLAGWVARSGQSLIVPDTRADERYFKGVDQRTGLELRSVLTAPLRVKQDVIGVLQVVDTEVGRFDAADLALLELLAASAAIAIENARLYEQAQQEVAQRKRAEERVRREATRTEALVRIAARLNAQLDMDTVLSAVCEETAHALNVPAASVTLYEPGREAFLLTATGGLPPEARERFTPIPRSLYDEYTRQMGPLFVVPDEQAAPGLPDIERYTHHNARTTVAASLMREGELVGTLNIHTVGEPHAFDDDELALLKGLADQAGLAIANTRLFEQVLAGREQLRELTGYLHTAREGERTRIAREIHDEFGQVLTALKMDLAWIAKRLPEDQTTLREKADSMSELIGNTLHMVRRIATELRPGLLDDLGLVAAIEWQAQEFTERTGIECELYLSDEEAVVLDRDLATALFRIFQETLTNVARHAGATIVRVDWQASPDELVLIVRDNGKGITESQVSDPKSLGLVGMREYTRSWGGDITFQGVPGQGTTVTVRIPRANQKEGRK